MCTFDLKKEIERLNKEFKNEGIEGTTLEDLNKCKEYAKKCRHDLEHKLFYSFGLKADVVFTFDFLQKEITLETLRLY